MQATALLASLGQLKTVIAEALLDLPPISEDVDISLEDAKVGMLWSRLWGFFFPSFPVLIPCGPAYLAMQEFYELCPDAAAKKGLTMMEAVKCSKATGSNLRMLYTTQELFLAFGENVKRVADELAASSGEVELLMNKMLTVRGTGWYCLVLGAGTREGKSGVEIKGHASLLHM